MFALYSAKQIILSVHVIVVCVFVRLIDCDNAEYNLTHTLLKNYDASIRPSLYHKYAVNVTFGLALTQIIDVVSSDTKRKMLFSIWNIKYLF